MLTAETIKSTLLNGLLSFLCLSVGAQTGGQFEIKQTVIAGGGASGGGGVFAVTGTSGQASAGVSSVRSPFTARGGFWQSDLVPTAALVSISGRVLTADGRGLRNAIVLLSGDGSGLVRIAKTSSFGYFLFDDVQAGQAYVVTVRSKRFQFQPRILNVFDAVTDLELTPLP